MWKNLCMLWRTLEKQEKKMAIWATAMPQLFSGNKNNMTPAAPRRYMPGAPEIYFHKAIDNSRLVRATDPVRKREMNMFAVAVMVCCIVVLVYVVQHCNSLQYGYKIEDARTRLDEMANVNRSLKLEEATLKDPERINALAQEMGMALPAVGQVQRLEEAGSPETSVPVMARANNISVISVPN
jgi:cell division protein FtsL